MLKRLTKSNSNNFLEENTSINVAQVCATKQIYYQLNNALQSRLKIMKEIEIFFIEEINDREKMSKVLDKYISTRLC